MDRPSGTARRAPVMRQAAAQGCVLAGIALVFGLNALRYPVGTLDHPGPGLFPLLVSAALLLLSVAVLAGASGRSLGNHDLGNHDLGNQDPGGLDLRWRNIGILLLALVGFVAATRLATMAAGIAVLVFTAGLAARRPSLVRSAVLTVILVAVALGFERLLGLRLRVF